MTFVDTNDVGKISQYEYCSLKPIRDKLENQLSPPSFGVVPVDNDRDGQVDQYNITMRFKKPAKDMALQ